MSNTEKTESKMQFILDENGQLTEIPKDKCKPVEHPIKYKLKNAFEVFVRVDDTENYWISNYGRCVNNLNHKDKNTFYEHKQGKCHYTVYDIEKCIVSFPILKRKNGKGKIDKSKQRYEHIFKSNTSDDECKNLLEKMQNANERRKYDIEINLYKRETSPEELVAHIFLAGYERRTKVWHKDGDESNNWYKNLIMVSPQDYKDLITGKVTWQELNLEQEYIEYENKASFQAYKVYNGIKVRCGETKDKDNIHACYDKSTMWQVWLNAPKVFVKWYLEHYYEVEGEEMDVDKDLFGDGSSMYHSDFCCILPKGLNTMLANSKKHYFEGKTEENSLPLGVRYSGKNNKYYGEIIFTGTNKLIRLCEWDTPEEAFAEYRMMKQADILRVAAEYKGKIPEYIYKALLKVEVKPY